MRSKHIFYFQENLPVEYSMEGNGIPVLVMHGGHSNCLENLGYDGLINQGYALITPSRAGYGRTSHLIGTSLESACNAYVSLLDHLKIDKAHIIAISAGGPSGIYLCSRYPERVRSLVLQSAVSKEWLRPEDKLYKAAQIMFRPPMELVVWTLLKWLSKASPRFIFKQMASSFSKLSLQELWRSVGTEDIVLFSQMMQRQRSRYGFTIDISQTKSIQSIDLQTIECPALIMHSKHDHAVEVDHASYAHQHIEHSELHILDSWGHLIWLGQGKNEVSRICGKFMSQS